MSFIIISIKSVILWSYKINFEITSDMLKYTSTAGN